MLADLDSALFAMAGDMRGASRGVEEVVDDAVKKAFDDLSDGAGSTAREAFRKMTPAELKKLATRLQEATADATRQLDVGVMA